MCPYRHDVEKVSVCPAFLRGECHNDKCLLRHQEDHLSNRMPVCVHFLKGTCTQKNCQYLHVKVNDDAEPCPEFQSGFCPRGPTCNMKHEKTKKVAMQDTKNTIKAPPSADDQRRLLPSSPQRISKLSARIIPKFAFE
jgi:hypothetical protein